MIINYTDNTSYQPRNSQILKIDISEDICSKDAYVYNFSDRIILFSLKNSQILVLSVKALLKSHISKIIKIKLAYFLIPK